MILQDIFEFNQPNLEGGLDLSIHEEDIWPVRIHVQNLVVVPDIEMLFKWSVVESRQDIYDDSNLLVPRLVAMLAIASSSSVADARIQGVPGKLAARNLRFSDIDIVIKSVTKRKIYRTGTENTTNLT